MEIGKRLKCYRKFKQLSQEELSSRADINEKYYGRIERGESIPTIDIIEKICKALDIDLIELFLYDFSIEKTKFIFNPDLCKTMVDCLKDNINIHINRTELIDNCLSSIWYNGFIGSMSFDEFELKIYATGNIKGRLFIDYIEVLELNGSNIAGELQKYIQSDEQLKQLVEYMSFDTEILVAKNGNVLFLSESNWLSATLINNRTNELLISEIVLDTDDVIESLGSKDMLFDLVFNQPE